jgi:hypothetical protein
MNALFRFHPCSFRRSESHIDAIARLQPLLDAANATSDESILLNTAQACQEAGLPTLAEYYRRRAGQGAPTEREKRLELMERALKIITEQGRATPLQLQLTLGLTRKAWYKIAAPLRKSGRVDFIERKYYVPRRERLL